MSVALERLPEYLAFASFFLLALGGISVWLSRTRRNGRSLPLVWAGLLVSLLAGWFLAGAAEDAERERLRAAISGFAPTYAAELQAMGHQHIGLDTQPEDPRYQAMIEQQKRWLELNPKVADIYTFRKDPAGNALIVDSETDYDGSGAIDSEREERTEIGEVWKEKSDLLDQAFLGGAGFEDRPYEDRWGTWVSAYEPMFDDEGNVEAVLGVDYPARSWISALARARWMALGSLALFLCIALSLVTVIAVLRASLRERLLAAEKTRQVIDQAHDAFVAMDQDGVILDWNPQSTMVFGWERDEALGRRVAELLLPERYREAHEAGMRRYLETGVSHVVGKRINVIGLHRDGHEFPIEMTLAAIRDGHTRRFHAFLHDISERMQREELLRDAKDGAEAATRAKSEFIASVSHEIRTPLNGILGMHQLLATTKLDERQRGYLDQIRRSSNTLLYLLSDVLDMSRIEAGKVDLESRAFDVRACVHAVVHSDAVRAEAKGLTLDVAVDEAVPQVVRGDAGRLAQVLANLVGNAIKFTEAGGVRLAVAVDSEGDEEVCLRFSVADTGIGIPEEKQRSIFDAFSQEDASTTRRYGGTGLGLSICRHLVGLMDGSLSVESQVGRGSTFHFTAVLGRADAAVLAAEQALREGAEAPSPEPEPETALAGLDILVAEDGEVNQEVAVGLLELDGHRVTVVTDGAQAVEATRDHAFELVLMDLQMPVMDGLQATREIRRREASHPAAEDGHLPIIALTAVAMKGDREDCLRAGMDGYISKPIDRVDLRRAMRLALGPRRRGATTESTAPSSPPAPSASSGEQAVPVDGRAVDWSVASRRIPGGADGIRELAGMMQEEGPRLLGEVRRGLEEDDAERVRLAAHTLKGSAQHFLAAEVVAAAAEAEGLARAGDLDAVTAQLPRLEELVAALTKELAAVGEVDLEAAIASARPQGPGA